MRAEATVSNQLLKRRNIRARDCIMQVAWIKSDSKAILAIHTHMVAHNPRLSVTHNGHNTWKLHVTNVQPNDSGTYMCQVNTDPMRSQVSSPMPLFAPPKLSIYSSRPALPPSNSLSNYISVFSSQKRCNRIDKN